MSLRRAVAAPFCQRGVERLKQTEFVVALSLDREWFSPDQTQRLVDVAATEGLLERVDEDELVAAFDPGGVEVPDGFEPDESVLQQRSTFERLLATIVDAGTEKQEAVAAINRLQSDLAISVEAAAALYARRQGLEVTGLARRAEGELDG
ncbi:MAG: hypothetical protein J07HX64_01257 [halophilic archaeon J07HX64]|jgi:Uncharacterized protein conserved in archaea|nr:MAG: hypothetical protein J07HX64_01257 [halophilic archaeon J07HX64]